MTSRFFVFEGEGASFLLIFFSKKNKAPSEGASFLLIFFTDGPLAYLFLYDYRAFLDAVTSHLFVFEGDGLVRNFEGSFSGCVVN